MRQKIEEEKKRFEIGDEYKGEEIIDFNEFDALTNRDYEKAINYQIKLYIQQYIKGLVYLTICFLVSLLFIYIYFNYLQ